MNKKVITIFASFILIFSISVFAVQAQNVNNTLSGLNQTAKTIPAFKAQTSKSFTSSFLASYAGRTIGIILSFVGVLFLGLMIYAGLMWMLAQGNEQDVTKAKDLITNAIIGLIIVFAAYALTTFIGQNFLH